MAAGLHECSERERFAATSQALERQQLSVAAEIEAQSIDRHTARGLQEAVNQARANKTRVSDSVRRASRRSALPKEGATLLANKPPQVFWLTWESQRMRQMHAVEKIQRHKQA